MTNSLAMPFSNQAKSIDWIALTAALLFLGVAIGAAVVPERVGAGSLGMASSNSLSFSSSFK